MPGAPATHVEPLNRPRGSRPILSMQEDQLLQSTDCCVLQHLLQLVSTTDKEGEFTVLVLYSRYSNAHTNTHLSQGRFLVTQADDEDAISLTDAALSPRSHAVVSLVQDNPIDVLLLGQPAGQTVLMDTDG